VKRSLPGTLSVAVALAAVAMLAGMFLFDPVARADLAEGRDYILVPQQKAVDAKPASNKNKTEVMEFFSYGCPHCAAMHPHITKWSASLPANVEFVRVPVAFGRPQWGALSRAYYTLQNLGELKRLDDTVFESIHKNGEPIFNEANLTAWAAKQGIDAEKFRAEFNSERVTQAVMNAETLTRDFVIDSVPKMVVARRYKVEAAEAKSYDEIFAVASGLIDKAAKEKSTKR
jgi:protein dithiol oxidoreductase (disulfide-forming)